MIEFYDYIITENEFDFEVTTKENYYKHISDAWKNYVFDKGLGFTTIESVKEYIKKYFMKEGE